MRPGSDGVVRTPLWYRQTGSPLVPLSWISPSDNRISHVPITTRHTHLNILAAWWEAVSCTEGGERRSAEAGKPYRLSPNKFSLRQGHQRLSASFLWACTSRHIDCRSSGIQKTSAHPMTDSSQRPQQLKTEVAGS